MKKPVDDATARAALRQRFPKPSTPAAAFQFASILGSNAYLLYLVMAKQASPASLVAFNVLELILLSVIAHTVLLCVPKAARMPGAEGQPIGARIFTLAFAVPCQATVSTTIGATCAVSTSADALAPGTVTEGARSIWQTDQVQLLDGGPDGVASTGPNALFATQGVLIP